jgi:hypothetical protein
MISAATPPLDALPLRPGLRTPSSSEAQGAAGVAAGARATPKPVGAQGLSHQGSREPTERDPKGRSVQRHLSLAGTDAREHDPWASLSLSSRGRPPGLAG